MRSCFLNIDMHIKIPCMAYKNKNGQLLVDLRMSFTIPALNRDGTNMKASDLLPYLKIVFFSPQA